MLDIYVGMESKTYSGEEYAVQTSNDIIQDLTYAAILKDYGEGTDKTIMRPATYDSSLFICSCKRKECSEQHLRVMKCWIMQNYPAINI